MPDQGRIQDLKLGVAQINHGKFEGWILYKYISIRLLWYIHFKWDIFQTIFFITILYFLSPLIQYYNKKILFEKKIRGGARPVRPPLNPPLQTVVLKNWYLYFLPDTPETTFDLLTETGDETLRNLETRFTDHTRRIHDPRHGLLAIITLQSSIKSFIDVL